MLWGNISVCYRQTVCVNVVINILSPRPFYSLPKWFIYIIPVAIHHFDGGRSSPSLSVESKRSNEPIRTITQLWSMSWLYFHCIPTNHNFGDLRCWFHFRRCMSAAKLHSRKLTMELQWMTDAEHSLWVFQEGYMHTIYLPIAVDLTHEIRCMPL